MFTPKTRYGLKIMLTMGMRAGERVSGQELADAAHVSRGFALKTVRQLAKAGLLLARRGVGGGVDLARDPKEITLHEILEASGTLRAVNECILDPRPCDGSSYCAAHKLLSPLQKMVDEGLAKITLATLIEEQRKLDAKKKRRRKKR
jgi:Rrf2 family protein